MRGVGSFRGLLLGFVISILTVNVLFVSSDVSADTLLNSCSSATLSGDNVALSSVFIVSVDCGQPISFVSNTDSITISKIAINGIYPTAVEIVGTKLNLSFSYLVFPTDGLKSRVLIIEPGVIQDFYGAKNEIIILNKDKIVDDATPFALDDGYPISGTSLNIDAVKGLLNNDTERESTIAEVVVDTENLIGSVDVKDDGSFVYTNTDGANADDYFSYYVIDSSGNQSNTAIVKITHFEQTITVKFTNSNAPSSEYAKLGDKLVLEFSTNEYSTIGKITICGKQIDNPENYGNKRFVASYVLSDYDKEQACKVSIELYDFFGNKATYSGSDSAGITFDKTKPVIYLQSGPLVNLVLHQTINYATEVLASDANLGNFPENLSVTGFVDFDHAGNYEITYHVIDLAGNVTSTNQLIKITDPVNDTYSEMANELLAAGIVNNLSQINVDNYEEFSNQYFEKIVDGKKIGRITFIGTIDMSDQAFFRKFVGELPNLFLADNFGEVGINYAEGQQYNQLFNGGVEITFYNLNEIGYSNGSGQADILSNLTAYDYEGNLTNFDYILSFGEFSGCSILAGDCYKFSIIIDYFSKYVIAKDNIAPIISINKIINYKMGEPITFTGKTDDSDVRIIISIDGRDFEVPQINIKNGDWYFAIDSNELGAGKHAVSIVAFDFGKNQSARVDEEFMINKTPQKPEPSILNNILTQTASIAVGSPSVIIGDKIKGETKSIATVVKIDPELGLDKQELGLIFIVVLLGIAIIVVDRNRK